MTSRSTRHFVYILQAYDGRYYTGYTTDLERRLKEHQTGSGGKFTRSFGADKILYYEAYDNKSEALKREAQIKGWGRAKKKALISINPLKLKKQSTSHQSPRFGERGLLSLPEGAMSNVKP